MNAEKIEKPLTQSDRMMIAIVSKLSTVLSQPENVIIKQDDEPDNMYFISTGDCAVNVRDQSREELVAVRLLVEGDHFGEIGVVYECRRTATVISRNYNTMASLTI